MKYILLTGLLLFTACGSSTEPTTITETIIEEVIIDGECDAPVTCEVCPEPTVCPIIEPIVEPEPATYYQQVTHTLNGEDYILKTYSDDGYLLTNYRVTDDRLTIYTYDNRNNRLSEVVEINGTVESYLYTTYDERDNILTQNMSNGFSTIYTYDELNRVTRYEVTYSYGVHDIIEYTYTDNTTTKQYLTRDRTDIEIYDDNENLLSKEVIIDGNSNIETWTWEAFTL